VLLRLVVVWLINTLALLAVSYLMPSVQVSSFGAALVAALLLGLVNAFVRPLAVLISLPLTVLTLGLFLLVVNAAMLGLTALLVPGFHVAGFWPAFWGAVVVSITSWAATRLFGGGPSPAR
jgi:putative membrane protein